VEEYPQSVAPQQGFLSSANQQPMDPLEEPRYMGANWERPWRAIRINTLLRNNPFATAEDMRAYQTDPGSARADLFVPAFLAAAQATHPGAPGTPDPSPSLQEATALLAEWDRTYRVDREGPLLFEEAMSRLGRLLWDEFRPADAAAGENLPRPTPSDMMTAVLLEDPESPWWDRAETPQVEDRDALLVRALEEAWDRLVSQHGTPEGWSWHWGEHRTASIHHLLRIPSLGRMGIPMQGGTGTLNPSSGSGIHGASWRMVVELGDEVTARAVYPGGQSGHPLSRRYDDRLDTWAAGRLDTLRVPASPGEVPETRRRGRLLLSPGEG
jgi:penicillin amidase